MKKIFLCSLFACLCVDIASASVVKAPNCRREFRPSNNNWFAGANEYLFPTEEDYMKVINRGTVYECDNQECPNNSYVEMPANHFFNGFSVPYKAFYKCIVPTGAGNDKWEKVDIVSGLTKCTKPRQKWGGIGSNSDEYLYPTKADYDAVRKDEYGYVYECDSNVCPEGSEVILDSVHYFGKERIAGKQRYVCHTNGGSDYWMKMNDDGNDGDNGGKTEKKCVYKGLSYGAGALMDSNADCKDAPAKFVSARTTGSKCYVQCMKNYADRNKPESAYNLEEIWTIKDCLSAGQTPVLFDNDYGMDSTNTEYSKYLNKILGYRKCEQGNNPGVCDKYKSDAAKYDCCIAKDAHLSDDESRCICNNANLTWNGKKCVGGNQPKECSKYRQDTEAYKCCMADGAVWVDNLNRCECEEDDKTWDAEEAQCLDGNGGGNGGNCIFNGTVDINCDGKSFKYTVTNFEVKKKFLVGTSCNDLKSNVKSNVQFVRELEELFCGKAKQQEVDQNQAAEARNAISSLNSFFQSTKADVWKDNEGKFNTARLASDLTAGVVLGTVGGVVSGVVIKKKQIEKGFEVLHCSVGGQSVADWGDEFMVGLAK